MSGVSLPSVRSARRRNWFLWGGTSLLALFAVLALFGPALAPYQPDAQDLFALLQPPSSAHWLGTDEVGRDIASRIIVGTRSTLSIALASVALAGAAGIALGLLAGYFGGVTDRAILALLDVLLTIPSMVLAIAVVAVAGANAFGLTVAITISFIPSLARLVRARVLEVEGEDYIAAARGIGMSDSRVLLRHVLPNTTSVVVIELSLMAGQAVLIAAALGFLGLGVEPPRPEWGAMLGASRQNLEVAPFVAIGPGLAVSLLVLAFNLTGDGLRDWLDPTATS